MLWQMFSLVEGLHVFDFNGSDHLHERGSDINHVLCNGS